VNTVKIKSLFIVFFITLVFGVVLYDYIDRQLGFSYIDEIISIVLLILWFVFGKRNREFIFVLAYFTFTLTYSLLFPHNVTSAIITDFIIQLKPFVAFYTVYNLNFYITSAEAAFLKKTCFFFSILLIPVAILGFGGGPVMNYISGGHARFATTCTILSISYLFFGNRSRKDTFISLLILIIGVASLRSKFLGYFCCFVLIVFLWNKISTSRFFTKKTIILFVMTICGGLYISWDKVSFYFLEGGVNIEDESHMFARPYLYKKGAEILNDYPLLGTGLGSYATHASAVYYSPIYKDYGMIYNYEIGQRLFLSDTFYPSLVEFGYTGILLYVLFWYRRMKCAYKNYQTDRDSYDFKTAVLIAIFFAIEGIADSTFTHNRGMYMLMLLALTLKRNSTKWQEK